MTWASIIKNTKSNKKIVTTIKNNNIDIEDNKNSINDSEKIIDENYQIEINNEFDKKISLNLFDNIYYELQDQKMIIVQ